MTELEVGQDREMFNKLWFRWNPEIFVAPDDFRLFFEKGNVC